MSSEEADKEDNANSLREMSSLNDDFARMHFQLESSAEEVADDEKTSNVWSEIKSEFGGDFLEDHGIVQ